MELSTKLGEIVQSKIEDLKEYSINEVKSFDRAHGEKLPHKLIHQFFQDQAPKYDSLAAVEQALHTLYKKNNIETTVQGVKQVISNYKKKVQLTKMKHDVVSESVELYNEVALTGQELKKQKEIVKNMKKHYNRLKRKFDDESTVLMHTTASVIAQETE